MKLNIVYSIFGVVFKTLYPLIVFPYITRVLGVANLGEYNYYSAAVNYFALFSNFGIGIYATKEIGKYKDNITKRSFIFWKMMLLSFLFSFLVYVLLALLSGFSTLFANIKLLIITSVVILSNAIGAEWLFVALEKQKYLLIRNVLVKILSFILLFLFVKNDSHLYRYAAIMSLSVAGVSFLNLFFYSKEVDWKGVKIDLYALKYYIKPLSVVFIMDIFIHYFGMMDLVLLGVFDTNESVGYYSMASKVYFVSYSFLAATAIPLLPRASYYWGNGMRKEYDRMINRCYDIYILFSTLIVVAVFCYSDWIVILLGGDAFAPAVNILKVLILTLLFSSVFNFYIFQIFYPQSKTKLVIISQITGITINIILTALLVPLYSYIGAAVAFLLSYICMFFMLYMLGHVSLPHYNCYMENYKIVIALVVFVISYSFTRPFVNVYNFVIYAFIDIIIFGMVLLYTKHSTVLYLLNLILIKIKRGV